MKIILLKDMVKLGKKYDVKEVSSGYALNMLIPQGNAIPATIDSIKRIEIKKKTDDVEKKVHEDLLVKNIKDLDGITLNITGKANEKGHLFAGLHKEEIVMELKKQTELQIDPSFVQLEHPIKEIGEHIVEVRGGGKSVKFKIQISAI